MDVFKQVGIVLGIFMAIGGVLAGLMVTSTWLIIQIGHHWYTPIVGILITIAFFCVGQAMPPLVEKTCPCCEKE